MQGLLALLNRALQADSRQWTTSLMRATTAGVLLLVAALMNQVPMRSSQGLVLMSWLLWIDYAGITLASFSTFASIISEEREQRTLGLLRMTEMNSFSLVVGKWLPRLAVVGLLLFVQLPIAVLALTLGGITLWQIQLGYVALFAYTVMMTAIALLASSVCSTSNRASYAVGGFWFFMTAGPPFLKLFRAGRSLGSFWVMPRWLGDIVEQFHEMSLFRGFDGILSNQPGEAWLSSQVIGNTVIGLVAVVLAWFLLEFVLLYRLESKPPRKKTSLLSALVTGRKRESKVKRPSVVGRCWKYALAWREFHFVCGGTRTLILKLLLYPGIVLMVVSFSAGNGTGIRRTLVQTGPRMLALVGFVGLSVEFARVTIQLFSTEVHEQTLGKLVMLPMSVAQLAYTKLAGAALSLIPVVLTMVVGCCLEPQVASKAARSFFSLSGLNGFMWYAIFVHLAILLSFFMKSGASLISFILCCMAAPLLGALRFVTNTSATTFETFTLVAGIALVGFMHLRIGHMLKERSWG